VLQQQACQQQAEILLQSQRWLLAALVPVPQASLELLAAPADQRHC
jgi:hypothetical protein